MTPSIAIVGAGVGGLLLARLLEINEFEYIIYNQGDASNDPALHGTMDMHVDTAQVALKEAGLFDEFRRLASSEPQDNAAFDHRGELIAKTLLDLPQIDWRDLRALLLNSVPTEKIRWHARIERLSRDGDGVVTLVLDDGSVEKDFRLVVGADGVWSKVRHLLTGAQPEYFGVTYLRTSISATSPFWSTVVGQAAPTTYYVNGRGRQMIGQKNIAGSCTVYIGLQIPEDWNDPLISSDPDAFRVQIMHTELSSHKPRATNVVRYSDGPFHIWRLYTMPAESLSWASIPGVALVGDALHPTLPWPGEAISTTMYDSLQLGQQIAKFGMDGLAQAVSEYEKLAFPRRREHFAKCEELGQLLYSKDAVQRMEVMVGGLS